MQVFTNSSISWTQNLDLENKDDYFFLLGVFALLFAVGFLKYLQTMLSKSEFKSLVVFGGLIAAVVVFLSVVLLTYTGYIAPWSGRYNKFRLYL